MADLPVYDHALQTALSVVKPLDAEVASLTDAGGRVLRKSVTADRDQPPFDRSAMDGFALSSAAWQAGKACRIVGSVPAGGVLPAGLEINPSQDVVRIATGAAVPTVFDAVVPIEKAVVTGDGASVRFEVEVVAAGAAVHPRGADARAGQVVIEAGTVLRPHHLGIAAAVGAATLEVSRRPRVVVLSSGDEVVAVETPRDALGPQQIRNSNGPMLVALLRAMGCEVVRHEHVLDDADAVKQACKNAVTDADLVVTAGGVSVGTRDLFPATWPTLGYQTVLHGVAMQPGKPVLVVKPSGAIGGDDDDNDRRTNDPSQHRQDRAKQTEVGAKDSQSGVQSSREVAGGSRGGIGGSGGSVGTSGGVVGGSGDSVRTSGGVVGGFGGSVGTSGGVGLPGNPVSVLVTAHLFVWPMVRKMLGLDPALPWRRVRLASAVKPSRRRESFRAARLVGQTREQVEVLAWQGSGDLAHTASADGWVRLPAGEDGVHAGAGLMFLPMLGEMR